MATKKKKLTIKEKKYVAGRAQGLTQVKAARQANYLPNANDNTLRQAAHNVEKRPHVQQAIDDALAMHGLTPEWAVAQLGKVAAQDDELGAKRLASKDILELHGWNKAERPTMQLDIKNAFFGNGRTVDGNQARYIEAEE